MRTSRYYGVRKAWRQLLREGHGMARYTVARLIKVCPANLMRQTVDHARRFASDNRIET